MEDISVEIMVAEPGSDTVFSITSDKLIKEKRQIFTIPTELYEKDEDDEVHFFDFVEESIEIEHSLISESSNYLMMTGPYS